MKLRGDEVHLARRGPWSEVRAAKPKPGEAIPRGEIRLCDPRPAGNHRRIGAPDVCRPNASLLAAMPSLRELELRPFSHLAEADRERQMGRFDAAPS